MLKKLAQHKVDTSLFQSSRKLGRGQESKREALSRALREKQAGLEVDGNDELLFAPPVIDRAETDESSGEEEIIQEKRVVESLPTILPSSKVTQPTPTVVFGGGLKRPLDLDESGHPVIQQRKRIKRQPKLHQPTPVEDDWEGFSSGSEIDDQSSSGEQSEEGETGDIEAEALSDTEVSGEERDDGKGSDEDDDEEDPGEDDDDGDEDDDETSEDGDGGEDKRERSSAFKDWASQQRNAALGFTPSTTTDLFALAQAKAAAKAELLSANGSVAPIAKQTQSSLPLPPINPESLLNRKSYAVSVSRPKDVEASRLALPVVAEEQKIMEAIYNNDTTIISGETGSGKTTQIPQFLYEAGYGDPTGPTPGMIGVTQPRRVAAVSMAKRVAVELGVKDKVSHQIRFDSTVSSKTAIKFMTDGVLLREISQDFTLAKYSVIVIDEAHERSVNTDILIGMLSRIVETRAELAMKQTTFKPLKLIIMSATLKTTDFQSNKTLFRKYLPPIIEVEGRQYEVTTHFARKTQRDYVEEMYNKVSAGHKKLPPGGMLVFLTGQNEIQHLAKRLKHAFTSTQGAALKHAEMRVSAAEGRSPTSVLSSRLTRPSSFRGR